MKFVKYTATGSRKDNQDSLAVFETGEGICACVADGVGGQEHGGYASHFVVAEFEWYCKEIKHPDLTAFANNTNARLIGAVKDEFNGANSSTTFTGGVIMDQIVRGIHVGDSRVCVLRGNGIKQLTQVHTELGRLIREGKVDANDKKNYRGRNILEQAFGRAENFNPQQFEFDLLVGDRILFSTDGFHETLTKEEIRDLSIRYNSVEELCRQFIIELDNRMLTDNSTFICIEV